MSTNLSLQKIGQNDHVTTEMKSQLKQTIAEILGLPESHVFIGQRQVSHTGWDWTVGLHKKVLTYYYQLKIR